MAHHAKIENGIVTSVLVTMDSDEDTFADRMLAETGEQWVRTSYNARINGFRKNYAGIGFYYDELLDAFIPPQPFESWILDKESCQWNAPMPLPDDGQMYRWNEIKVRWDQI